MTGEGENPLYSKAALTANVRPWALPGVEREEQLKEIFYCTR